ncbi:hypothetical protein P22_0620 [Propionispora sp. 2/2-37]|uniref:sigma 54-interacting transcriptional regulator n=1 Tax=Propionispora sp. 2/2-37 TaxID=1677858 RepID=UPI0006C33E32|nr:sigma 54-interacting transcriptional regulator [Propionispora sp. 2/2-37]CUH94554.1 hypothetical protein P22_0620 [Propionispora sp. 2/2-37]
MCRLIDSEDKKNPYTDEILAKQLAISRSEVTLLRQKLNIPDSRERRRPLLYAGIRQILASNPEISKRGVTEKLKHLGFSVSRFTIEQLLHQPAALTSEPAAQLPSCGQKEPSGREFAGRAFSNLIGQKGSLFPVIEQAKAAILYPPRGLHTLLLGATGVGKSDLAEAMYRFAVDSGKLPAHAPFVVFNCADYADNPQLLLSQLCGHTKGAFTGADRPKAGLIEKADGGILFLDEVHRLPPEGQEILFYLIDKGFFRRMGETESLREVSVMLVMATTEIQSAALLATFRRRVPMVIELPSLQERPLAERLSLIQYFFKHEAQRTGNALSIDADVLKSLLLYDCVGNIGQLSADIQVACARGFLNLITSGSQTISITMADLPPHARRGLLKVRHQHDKLDKLRIANCEILPGKENMVYMDELYSLPREIYSYIEEQYESLSRQGVSQKEINRIIGAELEAKLWKWIKRADESSEPVIKADLYKVVGQPIVDIVERMLEKAAGILTRPKERIVVGLAIHLTETLKRLKQNKLIINPHLEKTREEYAGEFAIAREMAECFREHTGIKLPEEEIGFITLYLTMYCRQDVEGRVGILVLSHGHVAAGMAEVANRLLGVNHARAVEMSLDERPETALERTIEIVLQIDEGKGVLLLVDMGSLAKFGSQITELTGIPVRSVGPVCTMMVIEAVRRALLPEADLDELADTLAPQYLYNENPGLEALAGQAADKNKAVMLAVCITGKGAAVQLQRELERRLTARQSGMEIICLGLADRQAFIRQVRDITRSCTIKAVIGTLDPGLPGVPFITVDQVLNGKFPAVLQPVTGPGATLAGVLQEELIFFPDPELTKPQIIELLTGNLLSRDLVKPEFATDVVKRELIGVPVLSLRVAIPHGEDPRYVKQTAIALAIFPEAVPWGENYRVNVVCLMAVATNGKEIVQELGAKLTDEGILARLLEATQPSEIKHILLQG